MPSSSVFSVISLFTSKRCRLKLIEIDKLTRQRCLLLAACSESAALAFHFVKKCKLSDSELLLSFNALRIFTFQIKIN